MSEARRAQRCPPRPRAWACPSSKTTPTATCGSTSRRRAAHRAQPRAAASTSAPSPRCWRPACAWASWSRRPRSIPSCCRPSRPPTCTAPASTSAWCTRCCRATSWPATCRPSAPSTRAARRHAGRAGARDARHRRAWNTPDGGMFLWARLPAGIDAVDLLPKAVERGVAFVPGAAFYADGRRPAHHAPVLRHRQPASRSTPAWRRWPLPWLLLLDRPSRGL
jgi:hypothetical protein